MGLRVSASVSSVADGELSVRDATGHKSASACISEHTVEITSLLRLQNGQRDRERETERERETTRGGKGRANNMCQALLTSVLYPPLSGA